VEASIKVSFSVLPFGVSRLSMRETRMVEQEKPFPPAYVEPTTTDIDGVQIHYVDGDDYIVPDTTC